MQKSSTLIYLAVSIFFVSFFITQDAYSQCVSSPNAQGGVDAVCTGTDNNGFSGTNNPDMVTVEVGADVSNAGAVINMLDGNNTFIMNGGTVTRTDNGPNAVTAGQDDDTFIINGGTVSGNFSLNGSLGNDNFIINDGELIGQVNMSSDNDTLIMLAGSIRAENDAINASNGDDVIEILGGSVIGGDGSSAVGINGANGEDKITVRNATVSDLSADEFRAISSAADDDEITLGTGAILNGIVDCGTEFDILTFEMDVPEERLALISAELASKDPAGDSITIDGLFYEWVNCEVLINALVGVRNTRPIPTLSEWGLIAMVGALGIFGAFYMMRRRQTA